MFRLYETTASALFSRKQLNKLGSVVYLSVSPKEVMIGSGAYMPGPSEWLVIRQHLAENHKRFRKIAGGREVRGEELQRPPKGFAVDHPAIDLIRQENRGYCMPGCRPRLCWRRIFPRK